MTPTPMDLSPRFDAMLRELKASSSVRVRESTRLLLPSESATLDAVVKDLAEQGNLTVHPDLRGCWLSFARFSLHWESATDTDGVVGGEMALTYLYDVASHSVELSTAETPDSDRALLQSLRVIDDHPEGGNGTLSAVHVIDNELTPRVWFFDVRTGINALDLDYCGYLDALLSTKGLYGWQYLFAEIDLSRPEQRILHTRLTRGLDFLAKTFPDADYGELKERFSARNGLAPHSRN